MGSDNVGSDSTGCDVRNAYCDRLRQIAQTKWNSQQECVQACYDSDNDYNQVLQYADCAGFMRRAQLWCIKHCRSTY